MTQPDRTDDRVDEEGRADRFIWQPGDVEVDPEPQPEEPQP